MRVENSSSKYILGYHLHPAQFNVTHRVTFMIRECALGLFLHRGHAAQISNLCPDHHPPTPQSTNTMITLHVWGPGFGLPSIDPHCLSAIAYLNYAIPPAEWIIIPSSNPHLSPSSTIPLLAPPSSHSSTNASRDPPGPPKRQRLDLRPGANNRLHKSTLSYDRARPVLRSPPARKHNGIHSICTIARARGGRPVALCQQQKFLHGHEAYVRRASWMARVLLLSHDGEAAREGADSTYGGFF